MPISGNKNKTKKAKFLVTGNLPEDARRFLATKGLTPLILKEQLGVKPNGSFTRGSKQMGPFVFTCERSKINRVKWSDVSFLHVHYKNMSYNTGVIIV